MEDFLKKVDAAIAEKAALEAEIARCWLLLEELKERAKRISRTWIVVFTPEDAFRVFSDGTIELKKGDIWSPASNVSGLSEDGTRVIHLLQSALRGEAKVLVE